MRSGRGSGSGGFPAVAPGFLAVFWYCSGCWSSLPSVVPSSRSTSSRRLADGFSRKNATIRSARLWLVSFPSGCFLVVFWMFSKRSRTSEARCAAWEPADKPSRHSSSGSTAGPRGNPRCHLPHHQPGSPEDSQVRMNTGMTSSPANRRRISAQCPRNVFLGTRV